MSQRDVTLQEAFEIARQHHNRGEFQQAAQIYQQILQVAPQNPDVVHLLSIAAFALGQREQAIQIAQQAVNMAPDRADFQFKLGEMYGTIGQGKAAEAAYRKTLQLMPNHLQAQQNLGLLLFYSERRGEALLWLDRSAAIEPNNPVVQLHRGGVLAEELRLDEAVEAYRKTLALDPRMWRALQGLGNLYLQQGQAAKALDCYRQAIAAGDDRIAYDCLIFSSLYDPDSTSQDILRECERWRAIHGAKLRSAWRPHTNDRNPDRPLRIGYVSPDLCRHPISRFLLPVLSNHDRANYKIFCYSDVTKPDAITDVIRTRVDGWRQIGGMPDEQVSEMIRADQIDILVDLAMRTAKNRMFVFGRKPAPVQTCYLAYIGTTGLEAMDYRISDVYIDPPGDTSQAYTEKTIRLPHCVWCYAELEAGQIPVVPPPAARNGYITFGSLNTFSKMNSRVLDTWAEIMRRLPDSRLIMHCLPGNHREAVWKAMDGHGIARNRLRLLERQLINRYLSSYNEIDIALDPFPYPGGTTTCDALWMGVPVVTLAGERGMCRAGASLLSNVSLPELIADSTEQYIQIATALAADLPRLTQLRDSMRKRLRASPLMDSKLLTRDLESAYREMWRHWTTNAG